MKKAVLVAVIFCWTIETEAQLNVWQQQATPTSNWLLDVQFLDADYGYAVGDQGAVLRSSDGGLHWDSLPSPSGNTLNAIWFADRSTGWAGGNGTGILLHTTDGAQTWTVQDSGNSITDLEFVSPTTGWAVTFAGAVMKTTDAGVTWNPQIVPEPAAYFTSVKFISPDTGWISGKFPGTLLKTVDGGSTWTDITGDLSPDDDYNELFFADASTGWMVGAGFDTASNIFGVIWKTTNGGQDWVQQLSLQDVEFLSLAFLDGLDGYVGGLEGYLFSTTNGGTIWSQEFTGINRELSAISVRRGEGGWIVGPEGTILRNNFGGLASSYDIAMNANWNMISMPYLTAQIGKDSLFQSAASNLFYFDDGYTPSDTVRNGVGYWLKFSSAQSVTVLGRPLDSLTVPLKAGWNLIGGIASTVSVGTITVASPTAVLSSFFRFDSSGYQPTTELAPGLGFWVKSSEATEITMVSASSKSRPSGTFINTAMLSSAELPPPPPGSRGGTGTVVDGPVPSEFGLVQNYPNPFNPSTTIRVDLPEESRVTVRIYDASGREVSGLMSGDVLPAGMHEVVWDPSAGPSGGLSSGTYFYTVEAVSGVSGERFIGSRKMTYLK